MSSAFLDSTCQWYHTVFIFLWLTSLSIMSSRSIYVIVNSRISSLWLNNILLCVLYIYIHLYLHWIFIYTFSPPFFLLLKNTEVVSISSVQFSCSVMSDSLRPHELQHTSPPCPSPTLGVYPNSCPLSRWCHPTISSSVIPFSSCPQSFPASGSF